jgi:hypothetical protein
LPDSEARIVQVDSVVDEEDNSIEIICCAVNFSGGPWDAKKPPTPTTSASITKTTAAAATFPIPFRAVMVISSQRPGVQAV